jgi:DNA-binding XRE family transcriptional regulator
MRRQRIDHEVERGLRLRDEIRALRLRDAHPVRLIFARNLQALRHERGPHLKGSSTRTVRALAKQVGIAGAYLSQLESGVREPSLTMVARLADALDVPISALLETPTSSSPRGKKAGLTAGKGAR